MHHAQPFSCEQEGRQGGAHAIQLGFGAHVIGDRAVSGMHGVGQGIEQIAAGLVVVEWCQRGDDQLRGHLTGGMTAHSVGQC
ncbi:Uncharacterised protein [Mycobacteroides abscessus subsp. abscessus]|nr:Uncharacterised protein [Mycobacteroides abscessus subsp. abscessus]SKV41896.1 Uncharacterised protein [Mycobacteroides abscessus subsp. massiliense]